MSMSTPWRTAVPPKRLPTPRIATAPCCLSPRAAGGAARCLRRDLRPLNHRIHGAPRGRPLHDVQRRLASQLDLGGGSSKTLHAGSAARAGGAPAGASAAAVRPAARRARHRRACRRRARASSASMSTSAPRAVLTSSCRAASARAGARRPCRASRRSAAHAATRRRAFEQGVEPDALDIRGKVPVDDVRVAGDHACEAVARQVRKALADAPEPEDADRQVAGTPDRPRRKVTPAACAHVAVVEGKWRINASVIASACVATSPTP